MFGEEVCRLGLELQAIRLFTVEHRVKQQHRTTLLLATRIPDFTASQPIFSGGRLPAQNVCASTLQTWRLQEAQPFARARAMRVIVATLRLPGEVLTTTQPVDVAPKRVGLVTNTRAILG